MWYYVNSHAKLKPTKVTCCYFSKIHKMSLRNTMRSVTVFTYKIYHSNRSAKLHVVKGDSHSTSQSHPTNDPCAYATDITFPWCDNEFTFRELCMINAIDQDSQINAVQNIKGWKRHGYNENHENCERCHFPVLLRLEHQHCCLLAVHIKFQPLMNIL